MTLLYWLYTSTLTLFLVWSSYSYLFSSAMITGLRDLGMADYLRWELAILKGIAAIILIAPFFSVEVKEWAYAGVAFFLLTAMIAHIVHGDSPLILLLLVVLFLVLHFSRAQLHHINNQ